LFKFFPAQRNVFIDQGDVDEGLGGTGEHLLDAPDVLPQLITQPAVGAGGGLTEPLPLLGVIGADGFLDSAYDRRVDVQAPYIGQTFAGQGHQLITGAADHGGVKGAGPEVVHHQAAAVRQRVTQDHCEIRRCGHRLVDQVRAS